MSVNANDAKNLTWHANKMISNDKLQHLVNSPKWKTLDFLFLEFGSEARNFKLGICINGMNLHDNLRKNIAHDLLY